MRTRVTGYPSSFMLHSGEITEDKTVFDPRGACRPLNCAEGRVLGEDRFDC